MISGLSYPAKIDGLKELVEKLSSSNLIEICKPELTASLLEIHNSLRDHVNARYAVGKGGGVSQALKDKPSITNTKSLIRGELHYEVNNYRNMMWFVSGTEMGNIPPYPKQREGEIVKVTIRRGKEKVLFGKYGFGGFIPKGKNYVIERKSKARTPTKSVYGPTIVDLVRWVWETDEHFKVDRSRILSNMGSRILRTLNARTS